MYFEDESIVFDFLPSDKERAEAFFNVYEPVSYDLLLTSEVRQLKEAHLRTCRYCKKSYPDTKFDMRAHTIPEFLGNKFSISDFECDNCNKLFGEYEKQLSNFFGISIPVNRTKGKKKIPEANSYDGKFVAKRTNFFHAKTAIEITSKNNTVGNIVYNESTKGHSLKFETQPYIPLSVYKAFLKMALGLIPETELDKNKLGFDFLLKKELSKKIKGNIFSVFIRNSSIPYIYNGIFLFKKRKTCKSLEPPYCMVLFYGQSMYQVFIPFQIDYLKSIQNNSIEIPLLPPVLPCKDNQNVKFSFLSERLDSLESKTSIQSFYIIPEDSNEEHVAIDAVGNVIKDAVYNPKNITKLIIIDDNGFSIKISDDVT